MTARDPGLPFEIGPMNVHIAGRGNLGQDSSVALADLIKLSRRFVGIEARTVSKAPRVVA